MKTRFLYLLGIIVLLAACTPLGASTPDQAPEAAEATQPDSQPSPDEQVDMPQFDPSVLELGSWMYWFDDSIVLFIPAGEFQMGTQGYEDNPPRSVSIGGFWIYRNPVTNDMYRKCVVAGACNSPATEPPYDDAFDTNRPHHPVVGVNWEQAQTYCQWMSADLPTEAQWEKAARGPDGNTYPWGEDEPNCTLLNFKDCINDTTPVQSYYPQGMSHYELFDAAGNTFEWTRDWYQNDYYKSAPENDPFGPDEGSYRSIRSSGFGSNLNMLPLAHRVYLQPDKYRIDLGFRCVVTEPANYAPYCKQIAYIPGENKGPGTPPPGGPDTFLHQTDGCLAPDPNFGVGRYCVNQQNQIGGATVTYSGSLQSVTGVSCDNNNPMGCWGPENATFEVVLCTDCADWVPPDFKNPSCDPGYILMGDTCVFTGIPAIPATTCPAGWFLDADGYCKPFVMLTDPDCPDGFDYSSTEECCVATYIEPSGGWAGVPSAAYSSCPVGYDYVNPPGVCVFEGHWVSDQKCQSFTAQLGECRDKPPNDDPGGECQRPEQYSSQGPCENAGCKWNDTVGAQGYCSFP
ncbi:MAG: formylglycine-generating enzyme family protein [Anaerolineae bacterium]|jgi:formylglycine-generating enzyme|nr:formylglycine-generating enzyme family protein [Anaerolineae bacterium]